MAADAIHQTSWSWLNMEEKLLIRCRMILCTRVVYEGDNDVVVVTVMIIKRERYEKNKI